MITGASQAEWKGCLCRLPTLTVSSCPQQKKKNKNKTLSVVSSPDPHTRNTDPFGPSHLRTFALDIFLFLCMWLSLSHCLKHPFKVPLVRPSLMMFQTANSWDLCLFGALFPSFPSCLFCILLALPWIAPSSLHQRISAQELSSLQRHH